MVVCTWRITSMVSYSWIAAFFFACGCWLQGGAAQYESCISGSVADIGNGRCDAVLNVASCGFDGGDCCSCTCSDGPTYTCSDSDFNCVYPDCSDPTAATSEETTCEETWAGDGWCDHSNNHMGCSWDGGDCCECSCVSGADYDCGDNGYTCQDPACFDPGLVTEYPDCTGNVMLIGDGECTAETNNAACGYDGGDCCLCSCSGTACSWTSFDCLDPTVGDEFYECMAMPPAAVPCAAGVQQMWTVETSEEARALAASINCSGGSFEVEWIGRVVVDETIYVVDGTALTINGAGLDGAVIDGSSATRLFTVVDAALHLKDVNITSGFSVSGGAIAAAGSLLTFNRTNFLGNSATGNGGAVFATDGSTVSCFGGGAFANNVAGIDGGAMMVTGSSVVSCGGSWLSNTAGTYGGALAIAFGSSASWRDEATFTLNSAGVYGGALIILNGSSASWSGTTIFSSNTAASGAGAVGVAMSSTASWEASTIFSDCVARGGLGGAVHVLGGSNVRWSAPSMYVNNTAAGSGGALAVSINSEVSWSASTEYLENEAKVHGGALFVSDSSNLSWSAPSTYMNNSAAEFGGALTLALDCDVSWSASTEFRGNEAGLGGGAVFVGDSALSWDGEIITRFEDNRAGMWGGAITLLDFSRCFSTGHVTSLFSNNSAGHAGGGIWLESGSSVSFNGNTSFLDNTALGDPAELDVPLDLMVFNETFGGAMGIHNSSATWKGEMVFSGNMADMGGALSAQQASVSCDAKTVATGNRANSSGGAFFVTNSDCSWAGETTFSDNFAGFAGGGLFSGFSNLVWVGPTAFHDNIGVVLSGAVNLGDSSATWTGNTSFWGNTAQTAGCLGAFASTASWNGTTIFGSNEATGGNDDEFRLAGAVYLYNDSVASWRGGTTVFVGNSAVDRAGAVFVGNSSASWSGSTRFVNNSASSGGAVFVFNGGTISWTGTTDFTSNTATADGGVVGSFGLGSGINTMSVLFMNGSTTFANNSCGANGGALALLGGLFVSIGAVDVSFINNTAGVAGGAVFVSGTGFGPVFPGVSFILNSAEVGGAVSTVGSGNLKESADIVPPNPTTFERCHFIDNRAAATGGAIESAAGQDNFLSSVFENNQAGTGGALRLAGTAAIENCSFVDNVSGDEGGAAVSNIGSILKMENIFFSGNAFYCETDMYLNYSTVGDPYEATCNGCPAPCDGCSFDEPPLVPSCIEALDHTSSSGGTVTLEMLSIDPGYWRATVYSEEVLACYNIDACLGGVTGTASYCLEGYEGPYCSVCSEGYTSGPGYICSECSDSAGGIVLAVVLIVVALAVAAGVFSYLVSGEGGGTGRGVLERLGRYIPLQSVKIVVVAWQILTQFSAVANVTYPDIYERFLDGLEVFNLDLSWVLSAGCVLDIDFHDRLLMATIGPIVVVVFLAATYLTAARINRGVSGALQNTWNRHLSVVLLLTFFVYSSVSSVIIMSFACEDLEDGKNYLRADYRIECDSSKHRAMQVYAGLMVLVYPVGIPAFYGFLLYRDREVLREGKVDRDTNARLSSMSDLWKPYKPSAFYYEVIECGRRVLLAGVVVFIYPNTAAQIAISLLMAFVFVVVSEALAPYESRWDTWLNRIGHAIVFVSMYLALLLKVDVSDEHASSQRVFESLLVAAHGCLVLVVLVETVILTYSLRVVQRDEPVARFREGRVIPPPPKREVAPEEDNPFAGDIYQKT